MPETYDRMEVNTSSPFHLQSTNENQEMHRTTGEEVIYLINFSTNIFRLRAFAVWIKLKINILVIGFIASVFGLI